MDRLKLTSHIVSKLIVLGIASALLMTIACGTATETTSSSSSDTASPSSGATAKPTSAPAPKSTSSGEDKVTILVGGWGGRFAPLYNSGCHAFGINHGGFLVRSDENRQAIPGIATDWQVSDDGLTWTFTVRDNALFHARPGVPVL